MKRYILLSYRGAEITPEVITKLGEVLLSTGTTAEYAHGISLSEVEVCSALVKFTSPELSKELSSVESACIYVAQRFGEYFNNGLKLTLALSEAAINNPKDKVLINAIDIISHGVSARMGTEYGVTKEVVSVFKQINQSLKNV